MARDSKRVYQVLYKEGPLTKVRMREVLSEEEFEMVWIGAQNSHGKSRVAIVSTADQIYYGLTSSGVKQLKKW